MEKSVTVAQEEVDVRWALEEEESLKRDRWSADNAVRIAAEDRIKAVRTLVDLQRAAFYSARRLTDLVEKIGRDGLASSINTLGEMQGTALDVDRFCAVFGERFDRIAPFNSPTRQAIWDESRARFFVRENPVEVVNEEIRKAEVSAASSDDEAARLTAEIAEVPTGRGAKRERDQFTSAAADARSHADAKRRSAAALRAALVLAQDADVRAAKGGAR